MNLQEQINIASSGATLQHDADFVGNLTINKPITIQGSGLIKSPNADPAIDIPPGTGPVSLLGKSVNEPLRITHTGMIYDIIRWGAWQTSNLADVPQGLTLEHVDLFGQQDQNSQRGIAANGANFTIKNSKVREIHWYKGESQGIAAWNGPGPFKILDCYIEASTENILFGGADARIPNLIPSDIEIRRVHLFKPMAWRGAWSCKNALELKNARRVIIDGCVLENCWGDAQIGFAVLFTTRNQDGGNPWATVEDVELINCVIKNTAAGFQIIGKDYPNVSAQGSRIRIANNLIQLAPNGTLGQNRLMQLERTSYVTFENNEANPGHTILILAGKDQHPGLVFRKNVTTLGDFGLMNDSGGGFAKTALNNFAPGHDFTGNILIGDPNLEPAYPENQIVAVRPTTIPVRIGVDMEALKAAQAGTVTEPVTEPTPAPAPAPSPQPTPVTSSNGTKAAIIVDSSLKTWTLGANKETLRDGVHISSGLGFIYKWLDNTVYVEGTDEKWYRFTGTSWVLYGATEPGIDVTPTPAPVPSPVAMRPVSWPKQDPKRNQILDLQWRERYRLKKAEGGNAEFEYVP